MNLSAAAAGIGASAWRRRARNAAVGLVAGALLSHAAALPGGFGRGGFRGTPHEVPNSARSAHGVGEPFFGGNRIADPDIFLTVEEQFRRVQERESLATGVPHDAAPWSDTPHLRVRLTGDPQKDAVLIGRLERELGRPIDLARIRVASLVDDAATDAVLDADLSGGARAAGRAFERRVRLTPDVLDEGRLGALLEGHRGEVLLLIAHIDAQRQAIVFRDAKGGERLIGLQDLAQAELRAGVQVVLIGCHSSRFRAAGFVDSLNSLDAAAAVVRAVGGKPTSYRELFGRLAGPQLEMLIDPQRFEALGETAFVRPGSDLPVSTLRWSGAPSVAATSSATESMPALDTPGSLDSGVGVARASIAGIALLSWLAGLAVGWRRWSGHAARWGAALASLVWHAAALTVLCSAFAEAATDGTAATIGVVSALVAVPVALGLLMRAIRQHSHWIAFHAVNLVRALIASLPFFLVATLFALDRSGLPEPARAALLAVYHAVRDAPAFELAIGLAFVMVWVHYEVERAIGAAARRRVQLARARTELQSIGVSRPANLAAALRSTCAFLKAMHKHDLGDPHDSRPEPLVEAVAPDPWTDGLPRRFALVKLRVAHTPVLGLVRTGTAFVHPIPEALADEWREGRVGAGAMPRLLALIEPRLRVRDYLELPRRNARRLVPFVDRMIAGASLFSAFAAVGIAIWLPDDLRGDVYLWIAAAALSGPLLIGCPFGWQLRWMLYDRLLLRRLRAACGVAGLARAAGDKGLR